MIMKKILVMSALVAISAAFVACSSNDDLVQAPTAPEETIDEGTPLTIKVTDATRGTDWTATSLPSFSLYTVRVNPDDNTKIDRWLGTNTDGASIGQFFQGDGNGNFASGTLENETFSPSSIAWEEGSWDFYALSNKDATSYFDFAKGAGDVDLEDFAEKTGRNFTYTVPTDYNTQQDLLVGAALGQSNTGSPVEIPFQHALAQIGEIEFTFSPLASDVSDRYYLIKSITLHNIYTTGTFTFPDDKAPEIDRTDADKTKHKDNVTGSWTTGEDTGILSTLGSYHIELPQFQLDDNNNYLIFDEVTADPDYISENEPTAFASNTVRYQYPDPEDATKIIKVPNYFQCPTAGQTWSYRMPIVKKVGSEGSEFKKYDATKATYTQDGGLYIIPQALAKTVWEMDGTDIKGVTSGVYLEIHGAILYMSEPDETGWTDKFAQEFEGATGDFQFTNVNNYYATQVLNHDAYLGHYLIPLVKAKKILKAGGRYRLTFDLSKAVTIESAAVVFAGATVND